MNKRCSNCKLINFAGVEVCRRCGTSLDFQPAVLATGPTNPTPPTTNYHAPATPAWAGHPYVAPQDGIIAQHIGRTNRNLKVTNVTIVVVVLGLALLNAKYLYQFVVGPKHIDRNTLFKIKSGAGLWGDYVKVDGTDAIETGMVEVYKKMRGGRIVEERTTAQYYLLTTDSQALLVKVSAGTTSLSTLAGQVRNIPDFERQQILPQMYKEEPELRSRLRPVMLDARDYRELGYFELALGIPLLALGAWNLKKLVDRKREPLRHPVMRSLARFGFPNTIAAQIDADVRANLVSPRLDKVAATPTWFLDPTTFGLQVVAMAEIVWVYKHVTKHSVNFIPTGKSFRLMIADRQGKLLSVNTSEQDMDGLLGYFSRVIPWALLGYDPGLANAWRANTNEVIHAVDMRRRQYEAGMANPQLTEVV